MARPRSLNLFAASFLPVFLSATVAFLFTLPAARAAEATASTYATTSALSAGVYHEDTSDDHPLTTDKSAHPQDATASGGGATGFASASAASGEDFPNHFAPSLRVRAYGKAGGDKNATAGAGSASAAWTDILRLQSQNIEPPENFLRLYAVFHCHLTGSLSGPSGTAEVGVAIIIERTDSSGATTRIEYTDDATGPRDFNRTLGVPVPVEMFIGGLDPSGAAVYPTLTMGLHASGHSGYEPSEESKWVGDGEARFDSTFALDTIYFADEHGNPVSGFENFQIVGDDSPYVMGPPTNGFLKEVVVLDRFGRRLNERGLTLVDWEGQIANPAIRLQIVPPSDSTFPATAIISCPQPRVYFDEPSSAGASGPTKTLTFTNSTPLPLLISIFPDRDGADEDWPITIEFTSANGASRTLIFNAHVIDQDQPARPVDFPITVDFSRDQTGFFDDPSRRTLYQQLANDWAYFFADPGLDPVPKGAETTFIWNPTGFIDGSFITNSNSYRGYLLYAYGIDQLSPPYRSGGEPSNAGGFLTAHGTSLNLRRSGGQELEVKGNYNTLGWYLTTSDNDWWKASNLGDVQNDLASIPHHEMGHAFIFNPAQPAFAHFKSLGAVQDARVLAYQGSYPAIDSADHLNGSIDRLSGKGAFGYEYYGAVPARRWIITKLDLLVAQAIGYPLRQTSPFIPAQILTTALPRGVVGRSYTQTLQARGGVPFYRWSISSGTLPPGLALDSFSGQISGDPSAIGNFTFTVRLEDYDDTAAPVDATFTMSVEATLFEITTVRAVPTPQITYRTSANHTYRVDYSEDLQVWSTLVSNIAGTDSAITTSDPAGASRPRRFYRVIEM